ncbi:hypothetical protein [Spirosoma sp. KNUC1025]|uniref:hypothetical protein n=1 Tax=Spirosoma sp. KNUC1025 TaxID=2894082 RepID=UPI00386E1867|nr:hypothetical protein LN737_26290 [Spirosoma sp. KNUC1025]
MKTPIKVAITALFLTVGTFCALPGKSQSDNNQDKTFAAVMYPAAKDSKLWLCLEQFKPEEKVKLELVNPNGQVLFSEFLPANPKKRNAYRQSFDMSQLTDGKYTFRLSTVSQKEEFAFKLLTPSLSETLPARLVAIK